MYRYGEGHRQTRDVPEAAYSIVPAAAAFEWNTEGPVDFAHIYFDPAVVDHVVANAFDRDPASVVLQEGLGDRDPVAHQAGYVARLVPGAKLVRVGTRRIYEPPPPGGFGHRS